MAFTVTASAATDTSLLTGGRRTGFIIENTDANRLHVLLDSGTASTTNYSFSLAQNENAVIQGYSGPVRGCWAADGSGSALVTEVFAGR